MSRMSTLQGESKMMISNKMDKNIPKGDKCKQCPWIKKLDDTYCLKYGQKLSSCEKLYLCKKGGLNNE
jgi:hypothetical protein